MTIFDKFKKSDTSDDATLHTANTHLDQSKGWNSDSDSPPAYGDDTPSYPGVVPHSNATASGWSTSPSSGGFTPTAQLQIEAKGYDYGAALCGQNFEQIPVNRPDTGGLEYSSIRIKQKSNSCALVRGSDTNGVPLIATIYRWGPGRPPKMKIIPKDSRTTIEEAITSDTVAGELVEVRSRNMFSRTQIMETSFGTFEWRYGNREERKAAYNAHSLLILDKIESAGGLKSSRNRTRIAQMVRNDEFRTPGTDKYMGGNGGRVMMDLRPWAGNQGVSSKDVEAFVIASCICMLKREADRFKDAAIASVA